MADDTISRSPFRQESPAMQRSRNIILAFVISVLAITAIGTRVMVASSKTLLIAGNGVPGVRADMGATARNACRGLRYGRSAKVELSDSAEIGKFTQPTSSSPCRRAFLGRKKFDPPREGASLTLVVSRKSTCLSVGNIRLP